MVHFFNLSDNELFAIEEIEKQINFCRESHNADIYFSKNKKEGFEIIKHEIRTEIKYSNRSSLLRAYGVFIENIGEANLSISQSPAFENLTVLVDNSRNAVMKPEKIEELIRIIALMGYNGLMLYTEDTYKLDNYPYFGYMRGAFSSSELKRIDDYAQNFGIELIPCIQTLAHLNGIFRWESFNEVKDYGDALLCDENQTYCLIDNMLSTLSSCIRSRKIYIGMDEADCVGLGKHLKEHGYENRANIILRHLDRVNGICKKYGYTPNIWSDIVSKRNLTDDGKISDEILSKIPNDIGLTFWSYESIDENFYNTSFENHLKIKSNPVSFAGSTSSWFGWAPLNTYSYNVLKVALPKAKEYSIKNLVVTVWGDDGADASVFASLTTIQHYAEYCWVGTLDKDYVSSRFKTCVGADYFAFLDMESLCNLPERTDFGFKNINPYRYMFYQDIMLGIFDKHVTDGSNMHFAKCADNMRAYSSSNKRFSYIFDTLASLCDVLSVKAELGIEIYNAYHKKDIQKLKEISETKIPELIGFVDDFLRNYRKQWYIDNKMFGFEVQNIRISGVKARAIEAKNIIDEYILGGISKIDLLEEKRLYCNNEKTENGEPVLCYAVDWDKNVTPSIM